MPSTTRIERSIVIAAPIAEILPHLTDFHRWIAWSPWEGQDPELHRTYSGTPGSVGAAYAWKGNRKAGAGTMTLTRIEPARVDVDLRFTAPFRSTSTVVFDLTEADGRTEIVWRMESPRTLSSRIMGAVVNIDKLVGGDFEKGLAKLRDVVESA
jgi:hypothetical protein